MLPSRAAALAGRDVQASGSFVLAPGSLGAVKETPVMRDLVFGKVCKVCRHGLALTICMMKVCTATCIPIRSIFKYNNSAPHFQLHTWECLPQAKPR
jgi:hypothetical protein